jgi:WD40 repeat protein
VGGISNAQFTDRFWAFGDSAAINFKNLSNPMPDSSILRVRGTCVSICDSLGGLIFYGGSPNQAIWQPSGPPYVYEYGFIINKFQNIISNGDSLEAALWYNEMTIVPNPSNVNQFYIFTAGVTPLNQGFYYSLLDMSLNNGAGYVLQKNVQLQTFQTADCVTAIKHGNGRDWWVMIRNWSNTLSLNSFYLYLITPNGLSLYSQQQIGSAYINGAGQNLEFNSDGSQFYSCNAGGLIERFDFDRCSGLITNHAVLAPFASTWRRNYWSMALSPDDSKLYVSTMLYASSSDTSYFVQYDLKANNFLASADTLLALPKDDRMGLVKLGPDGKIYLSCIANSLDCGFDYLYCDTTWNAINENLSVVNYPDSLGTSCDFQPFSFYLGGHRSYYGLPNNPNYELGPLRGSACDTLTVGIQDLKQEYNALAIYYDTDWSTAFINAKKLKGFKFLFELYSINGTLLKQESGKLTSEYYTQNLNMSSFSTGVYIVRLVTDKEVLTGRFVKN